MPSALRSFQEVKRLDEVCSPGGSARHARPAHGRAALDCAAVDSARVGCSQVSLGGSCFVRGDRDRFHGINFSVAADACQRASTAAASAAAATFAFSAWRDAAAATTPTETTNETGQPVLCEWILGLRGIALCIIASFRV